MNAVERVYHYTHNIAQEKPRAIPGADPPADWPKEGHVTFEVTQKPSVSAPCYVPGPVLCSGCAR